MLFVWANKDKVTRKRKRPKKKKKKKNLFTHLPNKGIHMSANCIHSTFNPGQEHKAGAGLTFDLTYFLDETLGKRKKIEKLK